METVDKPLAEKALEAMLGCPSCGRFRLSIELSSKHFDSTKASDEVALHNFIEALKDIQERMANSGKDRLPLRLQIAGLQEEQ